MSSIFCHECGSTDLRTSQLNFRDCFKLLAMKYPVRCRTCKARSYAPIREALQLPRPHYPRTRDRKTL